MRKIAILNSAAFAATAFAAEAAKPKRENIVPVITDIVTDIPVPVISRGNAGSRSPFPFDTLEVSQSFGVTNKTAKQMSSIVSNQNRKTENFRHKTDEAGIPQFGASTPITDPTTGLITGSKPGEPIMEQVKIFVVAEVDPKKDPAKARVRVWRKQ